MGVQTIIAHKLGKGSRQHTATLQLTQETVHDYVVTSGIKIVMA